MITLEEYYMGRDKAYPKDLTDELKKNAYVLLVRVNNLLNMYKEATGADSPGVRSGWRPLSVNNKVPGASKKSKHIACQAIDIADNSGKLKKWVMLNLDKCEALQLWVESPEFTPTWLHLQSVPPKSGNRVFIP